MSDDGNNREDEEQHTEEISRQGQSKLFFTGNFN